MKIRLIRDCRIAVKAGEVVEADLETASMLINSGFATLEIEEEKVEPKKKTTKKK